MAKIEPVKVSELANKSPAELEALKQEQQEFAEKPSIGFGRGTVNFLKAFPVATAAMTAGVLVAFKATKGAVLDQLLTIKGGAIAGAAALIGTVGGTIYLNKKERKHKAELATNNVDVIGLVENAQAHAITQEEVAQLRAAQAAGRGNVVGDGVHTGKVANVEAAQGAGVGV